MHKRIICAALTAACALGATAATASAQNVRVVNHGLSGGQVSAFKKANSWVLNGPFRSAWGTPGVRFASSGWTIEFANSYGPIKRYCGADAAACHGLKHGRPYAIVDTHSADTGVDWAEAASHEMEEMFADPRVNRYMPVPGLSGGWWAVEPADPVEDYSTRAFGVKVSDFVHPAWYRDQNVQQDWLDWLPYSSTAYMFSCPSGYAEYWYNNRWHDIDGGCGNHAARGATSKLIPAADDARVTTPTRHARSRLHIQPDGGRVWTTPIRKDS
jgi:hypothetical protein